MVLVDIGKDRYPTAVVHHGSLHETETSENLPKNEKGYYQFEVGFEECNFVKFRLTSLDKRACILKSMVGLTLANFIERNCIIKYPNNQ